MEYVFKRKYRYFFPSGHKQANKKTKKGELKEQDIFTKIITFNLNFEWGYR